MRRAAGYFSRHIGRMVLPVIILLLWLMTDSASPSVGVDPSVVQRTSDLIQQATAQSIQPGDNVLFSTPDDSIHRSLNTTGAILREIDLKSPDAFQTELTALLDGYCSGTMTSTAAYLIWTENAFTLGPAMRGVNFFFNFQAVLPYKGYNVYAVDKFLRLKPKTDVIGRYCEARKTAVGRDVVVILEPRAFSPWIGSVRMANITWLASDPLRVMLLSDFTVDGMPPVSTYDAYWLGFDTVGFPWSYKNSDAVAYREVFSHPGVKDSLLLMDKGAVIGPVAGGYVRECEVDDSERKYFRRVCAK